MLSVIYHLIWSILVRSDIWNYGNSEEEYLVVKLSDLEKLKEREFRITLKYKPN